MERASRTAEKDIAAGLDQRGALGGIPEMTIAIGIGSLFLALLAGLGQQQSENVTNNVMAQQMRTINEAARALVVNNLGTYIGAAAGTRTITTTNCNTSTTPGGATEANNLIIGGYLPQNFRNSSPMGHCYRIQARGQTFDPPGAPPPIDYVEVLVIAEHAPLNGAATALAMDDDRASRIANLIGAGGGMIPRTAVAAEYTNLYNCPAGATGTGCAVGSAGAWVVGDFQNTFGSGGGGPGTYTAANSRGTVVGYTYLDDEFGLDCRMVSRTNVNPTCRSMVDDLRLTTTADLQFLSGNETSNPDTAILRRAANRLDVVGTNAAGTAVNGTGDLNVGRNLGFIPAGGGNPDVALVNAGANTVRVTGTNAAGAPTANTGDLQVGRDARVDRNIGMPTAGAQLNMLGANAAINLTNANSSLNLNGATNSINMNNNNAAINMTGPAGILNFTGNNSFIQMTGNQSNVRLTGPNSNFQVSGANNGVLVDNGNQLWLRPGTTVGNAVRGQSVALGGSYGTRNMAVFSDWIQVPDIDLTGFNAHLSRMVSPYVMVGSYARQRNGGVPKPACFTSTGAVNTTTARVFVDSTWQPVNYNYGGDATIDILNEIYLFAEDGGANWIMRHRGTVTIATGAGGYLAPVVIDMPAPGFNNIIARVYCYQY